MVFNAIFGVAENGAFGLGAGMPWPHNTHDMAHFKSTTMGATLVMGYLTYKAIGKLPGRRTIVISREPIEGVETYPSVFNIPIEDEVFWIIGGCSLLNPSVFNLCERVVVSKFAGELLADVYFDMTYLDTLGAPVSSRRINGFNIDIYRGGAGFEEL